MASKKKSTKGEMKEPKKSKTKKDKKKKGNDKW